MDKKWFDQMQLHFFNHSVLDDLLKLLKIGCVKEQNVLYPDEDSFYYDQFYQYQKYTMNDIIQLLNAIDISQESRDILRNQNNLYQCLTLLAMQGFVVVGDVINGDDTYQILPRCMMQRSYFARHSDITIGEGKRFLVVSDTHIGDSMVEDFDLIDKVFHYARDILGIDTALHLGDVFQGIRLDKGPYAGYSYFSSEVQKILDEQLEKFKKYFPDYMKVIAIAGNKDESIVDYLNIKNVLGVKANTFLLSLMKSNFHLLQKRENGYIIDSDGIRISLSHPLRFNNFFPYVKTYDVDSDGFCGPFFKKLNDNHVDVFLSGHFHFHMNYAIDDDNGYTRRIYEVVPSLSKLCSETEDHCVGLVFRLIENDLGKTTYYGVMPLYYKQNQVIEGEEVIFPTNEQLLLESQNKMK